MFFYIIPGIIHPHIAAGLIGIGASGFGIEVIEASVVRNIPASETASSRATLSTFVGSMIPFSNILPYSSLAASYQ